MVRQNCANLFAQGFEKSREHYDTITAFELFEHLPDPMNDLAPIMNSGDNLIASTNLVPSPSPQVNDWWYYSPNTGQHISFYTVKAMQVIAERFGRHYEHNGTLHFFTSKPMSRIKMKVACKYAFFVNRLYRRKSLIADDYEKITGSKLN